METTTFTLLLGQVLYKIEFSKFRSASDHKEGGVSMGIRDVVDIEVERIKVL